jgi:hypothetical protein
VAELNYDLCDYKFMQMLQEEMQECYQQGERAAELLVRAMNDFYMFASLE